MGRFAGKVAVVTGAGSGIGRSVAIGLAEEGARVVCADVSGREQVVADGIGAAAVALRTDVTVSADVQHMVATAEDRFGRLDVLVNNAGHGGPMVPVADVGEDEWDAVMNLNLRAVFLGIKYAVPVMRRGGGGSIVTTASAAGLVGFKDLAAYSAAKGGVVQLTKAAAIDYATEGIRVNAVCPGMTWTGLAGAVDDEPPPPGSMPQPMDRWGLPGEVAAAILFLASDEASFITGAAVPVDGGYVAR